MRRYFSVTDEYRKVWYKLCVVSDATKWPNILLLSELLFSLPFSNGHVECIFSLMNVIKTDRRSNLHSSTLSDLLEIHSEGPALSNFCADEAVALWCEDCNRRTTQNPRRSTDQGMVVTLIHNQVKMRMKCLIT